jgi:hypothetical protein
MTTMCSIPEDAGVGKPGLVGGVIGPDGAT